MPGMRTWLCCVVALASGCIVPRSMTIGQLASPVGRGATDISVFTGVQYASQVNPQFTQDSVDGPIKNEQRSAGLTAPNFEANLSYGFSDHISLNVHGSSAGLQPGVKFTLNKSKVAHVAIMPQVAFGYASLGQSNFVAPTQENVLTERNPSSGTSFTFLGGLKVLFSHRSGFYMGVGYDFLFNRNFNRAVVGGTNTQDTIDVINSTTGHQVSASVGLDIPLGWVRLRPEIAFAVMPGIAQDVTRNVPGSAPVSSGATGGFGWAIFPGFSIGIVTPKRELTADEEEEEAAKEEQEKRKRRRNGEEEEDDEDEDEDEPRRPAGKKTPKLDDSDEEDRPTGKKRRQFEDTLDED